MNAGLRLFHIGMGTAGSWVREFTTYMCSHKLNMNYLCGKMPQSSSAMQMRTHLQCLLDRRLRIPFSEAPIIHLLLDYAKWWEHVYKCSMWLQVGRVSWCPAAECGGRSEFSVGKVTGFWLLAVTHLTPMCNNASLLSKRENQPNIPEHQTQILYFWLPILPLSSSKSFSDLLVRVNPWWVGAGRSDPPNTQPRLTLMHHLLMGMEERNTESGAIHLLQQCAVDHWSSPAFISQLQQSATWPLHKNCSSEPRGSLSASEFSLSVSVQCGSQSRGKYKRRHIPYARTKLSHNTPYATLPCNPLCFISDGSWMYALG